MRKPFKRTVVGATLGLLALQGCDPNPGGPAYTAPPVAQGDASAESGNTKGKMKGGSAGVIGDPAK